MKKTTVALGFGGICLLLCAAVWFFYPSKTIRFSMDELRMYQEDLKPLLDVIASGEGDYTSVNRGRAGDTRSTWPKEHLGKNITEMTVTELRSHQGGDNTYCWYKGKKGDAGLYAVGRYQLIPCTLMGATLRIKDFDMQAIYDKDLQDTLGVYLILMKRPRIRDYLAGLHHDHAEAGQVLAKEFASVPIQYPNSRCERGQSYYCHDKAGNAAHISLEDIDRGLREVRMTLQQKQNLRQMIEEREDFRSRIRRFF